MATKIETRSAGKNSKGEKSGKDASGTDQKKTVLIAVAVGCIVAAAGMLGWQMGLFSKPAPPPAKIQTIEESLPPEEKPLYQQQLKLEEEQRAKSGPPVGS